MKFAQVGVRSPKGDAHPLTGATPLGDDVVAYLVFERIVRKFAHVHLRLRAKRRLPARPCLVRVLALDSPWAWLNLRSFLRLVAAAAVSTREANRRLGDDPESGHKRFHRADVCVRARVSVEVGGRERAGGDGVTPLGERELLDHSVRVRLQPLQLLHARVDAAFRDAQSHARGTPSEACGRAAVERALRRLEQGAQFFEQALNRLAHVAQPSAVFEVVVRFRAHPSYEVAQGGQAAQRHAEPEFRRLQRECERHVRALLPSVLRLRRPRRHSRSPPCAGHLHAKPPRE